MRLGVLLSFVLMMAPMSIRLTPHAVATPTLSAASVSIETISKSDEDTVSLGISIHAPQDHVMVTRRKIDGTWYEGSSFETILDVPRVLKSDFVSGDVIVTPSRPLLQDWTYHCYVTFVFSD